MVPLCLFLQLYTHTHTHRHTQIVSLQEPSGLFIRWTRCPRTDTIHLMYSPDSVCQPVIFKYALRLAMRLNIVSNVFLWHEAPGKKTWMTGWSIKCRKSVSRTLVTHPYLPLSSPAIGVGYLRGFWYPPCILLPKLYFPPTLRTDKSTFTFGSNRVHSCLNINENDTQTIFPQISILNEQLPLINSLKLMCECVNLNHRASPKQLTFSVFLKDVWEVAEREV